MRFINALKWSFISDISSKFAPFFYFILLARILEPEDFGVITASLMVISFVQIFWEAGMAKTLIQQKENITESANIAFWINQAIAFLITGIIFLISDKIAINIFNDFRIGITLKYSSLQIIFASLSSIHIALLQKQMKFNKLAICKFAYAFLPGIISIPLALRGFGYWSLVTGTLIGQLVQTILVWYLSSWRPNFTFKFKYLQKLLSFGSWVGLSSILMWFYFWADSLIVAKNLGTTNLGIYRVGNQFTTVFFILLFAPILPVLYSQLSRYGRDKKILSKKVELVIKVVSSITIPTSLIIFFNAESIGSTIFGEKWIGVGFVIAYLSLMNGFSWIVGMNGEFYRAYGKPQLETIAPTACLLIYIPTYLITIKYGLNVFVISRCLLTVISLGIHFLILKYNLKISLRKIIKYGIKLFLISLFTILLIQTIFNNLFFDSDWLVYLYIFTESITILFVIFFLEKNNLVKNVVDLIKK